MSEVQSIQDLNTLLEVDRSLYEVEGLRVKVPYYDTEIKTRLEYLQYSKIYVGYELLSPFISRKVKHVIEEVPFDRDLLLSIRELIKECASRDNTDFSSEGNDPSWYTLGDKALGVKVNGILVGFRVYSIVDDVLKLCLAYVHPDYRGQGMYSSLLSESLNIAIRNNCSKILVSTDATDQPMHAILKGYGFKAKTSTWVGLG
jgi:ribosomal protein S18 acetylase RimI-like enzyme